jgi:hypothetical protein
MEFATTTWKFFRSQRLRIIALLLLLALIAPHPAEGQLGLFGGLIGIITSGLNALSGVLSNVNSTLRNVIGPILQAINTAMNVAQQIMGNLYNFQRNVVYPQQSINNAQGLVAHVWGIYNIIRGIWNIGIQSATLPNPQQFEAVILSRNAGQIGAVGANFTAVYTPLPAATDALPEQRNLIDSSDAVSQAAMKRSIAIDAIADQELSAADQMMSVLQGTAPGTGEMIGAQAGAWLVRSHAYTQQAMAELMRVRALELAGQSARVKEAAEFTRDTRNNLTDLNR